MSNNNVINDKKKALLAYKEKILEEIKYYERSIDDFRANHKGNSYYEDEDSSDSEDDSLTSIDTGPSVLQLKIQQAKMKTCLQATQELTSLTVLQSEVNVLVEEPKFEKEKPVTEAGTWREVTAECRIDLVPFTISFYMHTPYRKFAAPSYRGLRVVPVKYAHEMELAKSVLHSLTLPSDAVEVLRNYAFGYRSRRTTLACLANKFGNALFMEPHPEGGFVLKCADLLEVSWRLENKWSQVAPFHHRMKFDLEYMDEAYIKIITQAHKQLLDPSIATDERSLLLAKIITTCLEVRGPVDLESDLESKTTERDTDIEKRDEDSEVMAPPKSLPKKVRPKNKGNTNSGQKRPLNEVNDVETAKKMKVNDENVNNAKKTKLIEPPPEMAKKRKINDVPDKANKVARSKNVKEAGNTEDGDDKIENVVTEATKTKNVKESDKNEPKTKSKTVNNDEATANKEETIKKTKTTKESVNTELKNKKNDNAPAKNAKSNPKNAKEIDINTQKDKTTNQNGDGDAPIKNKINAYPKNDENIKTKNKNGVGNTPIEEINKPKPKSNKQIDKNNVNVQTKNKNNADYVEVKDGNKVSSTKSKNKLTKEPTASNIIKNKQLNVDKENHTNNVIESNVDNNVQAKSKVTKEDKNTNNKAKKLADSGNPKDKNQNDKAKDKNIEAKKPKPISKVNKNDEIQNNPTENAKVASAKNSETTTNKAKMKPKSVATKNTDEPPNKIAKIANKVTKVKTVNANVTQTIKKVTEKNAINSKNTDKISPIVSEKNVQNKPISTTKDKAPEKVTNIVKKTKDIINKEIIKKPIKSIKNLTTKLASHRTALKVQNTQKINTGNTKMFKSGNIEKENGGKGTKIPMKKFSPITGGSSKKNFLRISPRKLPSKFKTTNPQEGIKPKMMKTTNIPRLMTKPVSKTSMTTMK
ncbi:MATH and LRR domain-containing protein PFE0570w-like [Helicoverpa zea]|uniref:MATH and LRR domain-containing protein PFE0570w-like n=1 Tax=Helicoverpa zea TaxID=7113 RepID=UPI001F581FAA|nr:MATH and LRR domain-containing protein PFE0570w-like [Helicoverpa zea]